MRKRNFKKSVIILLVLFISIGFAVLTTNLSMVANLSFRENTFDVHFENAQISDNTNSINNTLEIDSNDTTSLSFTTTLTKPTDYIEFTFYVVNGGTVDAQLDSISTTLTTAQQDYITYTLKYDIDDTTVSNDDYLFRGQSRKIKAHFEYKYDVNSFYTGETISTTLTFNYKQPQTVTTTVWNYEYSGTEQYFIVPKTGTYKLEVWGAQGGIISDTTYGGYGGYSTGNMELTKNTSLYIYVGGKGVTGSKNILIPGGYNGGGSSFNDDSTKAVSSGGGATHIALDNGLLNTFSSKIDRLIIVAGGGGGSFIESRISASGNGSSGGGYVGNSVSAFQYQKTHKLNATGGTQSVGGSYGRYYTTSFAGLSDASNGSFGQGGSWNGTETNDTRISGGGAGYYGGGAGYQSPAGGGSGYIGNTNLNNKIMYCYNCQDSTEEDNETHIKTRSTTNVSDTATSQYAKIGNGYAKITFIG